MIDIRDISYTEGDPLSPHVGGDLLPVAPAVTQQPGETVSTKWDIPGQPPAATEAQREAMKPKQMPWYAYTPAGFLFHAGLSPAAAIATAFKSPKDQIEDVGRFGRVIGAITPEGDITPLGETISGYGRGVMDVGFEFSPQIGIQAPSIGEAIGGVAGGLLSGLGETLKGALPWLLLIGAGYLLLRRK